MIRLLQFFRKPKQLKKTYVPIEDGYCEYLEIIDRERNVDWAFGIPYARENIMELLDKGFIRFTRDNEFVLTLIGRVALENFWERQNRAGKGSSIRLG